jgi:hypothetical protein
MILFFFQFCELLKFGEIFQKNLAKLVYVRLEMEFPKNFTFYLSKKRTNFVETKKSLDSFHGRRFFWGGGGREENILLLFSLSLRSLFCLSHTTK